MTREIVSVLHFNPLNMTMQRTLVMSSQHQSSGTSSKIMKKMEHILVLSLAFNLFSTVGDLYTDMKISQVDIRGQ